MTTTGYALFHLLNFHSEEVTISNNNPLRQ